MKLQDKQTLSEQITDIFRDQIIRGEFSQGEKVQEEKLAAHFSVSRATVRESIRYLEAEGLLDKKVNKYTSIHQLSRKEILDLFAMRFLFEKEAVSTCLKNHTVPFAELDMLEEKMKNATLVRPTAREEYFQADIRFHRAIILAMDNQYFRELWEKVEGRYLMSAFMLRRYNPLFFFGAYEEHQKILEDLKKGSGDGWKRHLRMIEKDVAHATLEMVKDGMLLER